MALRRVTLLQASVCVLAAIISSVEAGDRLLLQTKPVCAPGTFSATGTNCKPCPPQAMCLRMGRPCEMMPTCDPVTGKATSMCWVKKPAGSVCNPKYYGDQSIPAAEQTHVCSASGECLPKGNTTIGATGNTTESQQKPQVLPANNSSTVCAPGTFSATGTNCKPCPPQAMCARMGLPCEKMPTCDPVTGKATSMCWVKKPAGSVCNPKYYGDQTIPAAEQTHVCSATGECLPKGNTTTGATGSTTVSQQKPQVLPAKCPTSPMCRKAQGPCDVAPPCDPATGKPTSMCWVAAADDTPCTIPDADDKHICKKQQCVPAQAPAVMIPIATSNVTSSLPKVTTNVTSNVTSGAGTAVKCPNVPMCRMARGPCDQAPPCDSNGKPTSMCWVSKPDGAPCSPGMVEVAPGVKFVCKNQQCVAAR